MAFSVKTYGATPQWGVVFPETIAPALDAENTTAAIITAATFSASSQKYETVNQTGAKIGALVYDSECSFSVQATLVATNDQPLSSTSGCGPFYAGCAAGRVCKSSSDNNLGLLAAVVAPTWLISGSTLYPVIDSMEFAMSNTSARTASMSGTIYSF